MKNKVAEICLNFSVMSFIVGNTTSNLLLLLSLLQSNVGYHYLLSDSVSLVLASTSISLLSVTSSSYLCFVD